MPAPRSINLSRPAVRRRAAALALGGVVLLGAAACRPGHRPPGHGNPGTGPHGTAPHGTAPHGTYPTGTAPEEVTTTTVTEPTEGHAHNH
jgi:hypothetical protein